jgi:hypothetical protein
MEGADWPKAEANAPNKSMVNKRRVGKNPNRRNEFEVDMCSI